MQIVHYINELALIKSFWLPHDTAAILNVIVPNSYYELLGGKYILAA